MASRTTRYGFHPDPLWCPVCGRGLEAYRGIDYEWLRCPKRPFFGPRHFDEPSDVPLPDRDALPILFDPYTGFRR